jgi:hypothetical protein
MVPPPRPSEAGIGAPTAVLADATPEQQLTHALACFQAEVSPITAADLAEVVHSARPAFRRGIGWSAQLREQQGRSRLQVTVMHVAGAELCSESWADEASDLAETTGLMLAMLLGIPMTSRARAVQPYSADSEQFDDKPGEALLSRLALSRRPKTHRRKSRFPWLTPMVTGHLRTEIQASLPSPLRRSARFTAASSNCRRRHVRS